jgi:hypothetical protein
MTFKHKSVVKTVRTVTIEPTADEVREALRTFFSFSAKAEVRIYYDGGGYVNIDLEDVRFTISDTETREEEVTVPVTKGFPRKNGAAARRCIVARAAELKKKDEEK